MAKKAKITTKAQLVKYLIKQGLTEKQANAQLTKGYKVELEHTDNPETAAIIAADHLVEFPTYYTALAKMEKELESGKNKARYGKALGLSVASAVSRSIAKQSSNAIVRAVARGVSVGTQIGSIGALFEDSPSKSSTSTRATASTSYISPQTVAAIEEVKILPKRERNIIANATEGEEFFAFTYDSNGNPTTNPKEVKYVAFLDVDREYSPAFAAQSIRDRIGGNWKFINRRGSSNSVEHEVPHNSIHEYNEHDRLLLTPDDKKGYEGLPKWFVRVKLNQSKKKKGNRAVVEPLYFQPIPHGLLFNYENVKTLIGNQGMEIVNAKWEPATDKKIHEIKIMVEPKNVNKMKKIEGLIDNNIQATKGDRSGTRSIIVQTTPTGDLLFIVEDGISRVFQEQDEEIGI